MKYILIISVLCLFSCDTGERKKEDSGKIKMNTDELFFPNYEWGDVRNDTLYIEVMIDECGEFGGATDKFKMYVDLQRQYILEYERNRFNCDSIPYYHELKSKSIEFRDDILLDSEKKKVLSVFMGDLLKGKVSEEVYTNAGSYYRLFNNDSTLNIAVHSENRVLEKDFYNFKKGLGLPENKKSD